MSDQHVNQAAEVARRTSKASGRGIDTTLWHMDLPVEFFGGDHVPAGASGGFAPSVGGGKFGGADLPDH